MHYNYIAIEGNIGSGKTSLSTRIASDYKAKLILEQFEDNPFLPKFYEDQEKYSFHVELSFLAERYNQLKSKLSNQDLFTDFTIADYFISKCSVFASSTLKEDELQLFNNLFKIIEQSLPKPDLLVFLYLDIETLQKNISTRGRNYEQKISNEYLETINASYFEYFKTIQDIPVLIIDTSNIDFVNNNGDYKKVIEVLLKKYDKGLNRVIL